MAIGNLSSSLGNLPTGIFRGAFVPPPSPRTTQLQAQMQAQPVNRAPASVGGNRGGGFTPHVSPRAVNRQAGTSSGIDLGVIPDQRAKAQTIDDIIKRAGPAAETILRAGTESAIDFSKLAQSGVEESLSQFLRPQALEEQAALLGARGGIAQREAIAGIPISAAQQEADRRETVGLQRRAAAGGELGAGSTLLASGRLAGQQQANRVAGRVEQLEQLAGIDRQLLGDISRNREAEMARRSALQAGLGGQIANVGFGLAGPAVESIQTQAEITGLRGIASANRSAQNAASIANLAGQVFTPSNIQAVGDFFSRPPDTQHITTSASGVSANANFGNIA